MIVAPQILEKYRRAGKIAAEVREHIRRMVSEGMPLIDVCEKVESLIQDKGGKPAFPCNVSVNEVAAHYTSPPQDKQIIPPNSIVKVDIGVHIDGYIADTAVSLSFNPEYDNLVQAAEDALEIGVKAIRPGLSTSRFGLTMQRVIKAYSLQPISNLTGHLIGRYTIHAGKSLPNVFHPSLAKINLGEIYAIEPFVTLRKAAGKVGGGRETNIFRFQKRKSLKNEYAKQLCKYIMANFQTLPFAERWIQKTVPPSHYKAAFSELLSSKTLMSYPVFIEVTGKPVAQAEHTVLVVKNGCEVLT